MTATQQREIAEPMPCPFCGEAELVEVPLENDAHYDPTGECVCLGCGARGPIRDAAGQRADAIERWNTRTTTLSDEDAALVELLLSRCNQAFDGECHLTVPEAREIAALIERLSKGTHHDG